jgi:hypothetical protein
LANGIAQRMAQIGITLGRSTRGGTAGRRCPFWQFRSVEPL